MSTSQAVVDEYDLTSPEFFAAPTATLAALRVERPVHFHRALNAWVLTRYADVASALKDPALSVDRNGEIGRGGSEAVASDLSAVNAIVSRWMVFSDPPHHTRLRGAVHRAFQPQALQGLRPTVEAIVAELLDAADVAGHFDAFGDLGAPLAERVTEHMLGLPPGSSRQLKRWTEDLFELVGAAHADDEIVAANARGVNACRHYIAEIVRARRGGEGNDLVSQLVRDVGTSFSEEEVVGLVITLIAGAYETTAYAVANGLHALLQHPRELQRLRAEPELAPRAVEEILRYCGPALGVQRRALRQVFVAGTRIAPRERLYCMLHAANHDPEVFTDPGVFDIGRPSLRNLGLGLGPHFCLGAWLTRLEIKSAIMQTVERFPELALDPAHEPAWGGNFAMRGVKPLRLRTTTREA